MRLYSSETRKAAMKADNEGDDLELSKVADIVLKIAALVGVAAAIASLVYNFAICATDGFRIAVSVPTFLLALFVFSIAPVITDKTFGNFRDMDFSAGTFIVKASKLALCLLGHLMVVSLFAVAFYSLRAAGNIPNCLR